MLKKGRHITQARQQATPELRLQKIAFAHWKVSLRDSHLNHSLIIITLTLASALSHGGQMVEVLGGW